MSDFSSWAREVICFNQGKYIEFSYKASELHKDLARAVAQGDVSEVELCRDQLTKFIKREIAEEAAPNNFSYLAQYFESRADSPFLPRFCLKTKNQSGKVITLARDENVPYESSFDIREHSPFDVIEEDGQYVIIDDIATGVRAGYRNARLDRRSVEAFFKTYPPGESPVMSDEERKAWISCWRQVKTEGGGPVGFTDPRWCYRSVLVIPVTLRYNKLSPDFYEEINKRMQTRLPGGSIGRYIFAYLCMDHADRAYFSNPTDIDVGYMIADILSLYLVDQMVLVETSGTYLKAAEVLRKG